MSINTPGLVRKLSTLLILALQTGAVFACSIAIDPDNPGYDPLAEQGYYTEIFLIGILALLPANVLFWFVSRRKYLHGLGAVIVSILFQFVLWIDVGLSDGSCGFLFFNFVSTEFFFFALLLVVQVIWFLFARRRSRLP